MGQILMSTQDVIAGFEISQTLGLVDGIGSTIHRPISGAQAFMIHAYGTAVAMRLRN